MWNARVCSVWAAMGSLRLLPGLICFQQIAGASLRQESQTDYKFVVSLATNPCSQTALHGSCSVVAWQQHYMIHHPRLMVPSDFHMFWQFNRSVWKAHQGQERYFRCFTILSSKNTERKNENYCNRKAKGKKEKTQKEEDWIRRSRQECSSDSQSMVFTKIGLDQSSHWRFNVAFRHSVRERTVQSFCDRKTGVYATKSVRQGTPEIESDIG